ERVPWLEPARRQGTAAGPEHDLVDVTIEELVDGVGPAGREGPAEQRGKDQPGRGDTPVREDHGRDRGDEQQDHDPRLGQPDVGPHRRPGAPKRATGGSNRLPGHRLTAPSWSPFGAPTGAAAREPGPSPAVASAAPFEV